MSEKHIEIIMAVLLLTAVEELNCYFHSVLLPGFCAFLSQRNHSGQGIEVAWRCFPIAFSFWKVEFIKKIITKKQSEASESKKREEGFPNRQRSLPVSFLDWCELLPTAWENGIAAGGSAFHCTLRDGNLYQSPLGSSRTICLQGTIQLH